MSKFFCYFVFSTSKHTEYTPFLLKFQNRPDDRQTLKTIQKKIHTASYTTRGERMLKWAILFAINFYLNKFIRFLLPYWHATQVELVTSNNSSLSVYISTKQCTWDVSKSIDDFHFLFFSFQLSCLGREKAIHWGKIILQ